MDSLKTATSTQTYPHPKETSATEAPSSRSPTSNLKKSLQHSNIHSLNNQQPGKSLAHRNTKEQKAEDPIWQKAEFYELPGPVMKFQEAFNTILAKKEKIERVYVMSFNLDIVINKIAEDFKNLTVLSSIPSRLASQCHIPLDTINIHRENPIQIVISNLEKLSKEHSEQVNGYEIRLQDPAWGNALSYLNDFDEIYERCIAMTMSIKELDREQDKLKFDPSEINDPEIAEEYEELEKVIDQKNKELMLLKAEIKTNIEDINNLKQILIDICTNRITSKVLSSYFDQRKTYLQTHKEDFQILIDHYFDCSVHPYSRYKDNLNHAWSDLMPASYYLGSLPKDQLEHVDFKGYDSQIRLLPENERYTSLKAQLNAYHNIPKTDESRLETRQKALKAIAHTSADLIKNSPQGLPSLEHEILQEIIARCNLKGRYLKQLTQLEAEALSRVHHLPKDSALPKPLQVISTKTQALHNLDPEKRYGLEDLHKNWLNELKKDPNTPNFWLWLETQNTASLSKDLCHTFINQGLKHIQFKDGLAYNEMFRSFKPDSKGLIEDGKYVYNIGQDGDLYILPESTLETFRNTSKVLFQNPIHSTSDLAHLKGGMNHDTILGGGNILCAGIVEFKDSKIVHIDTNSGHYQPDMNLHLKPALAYFLEKNPGTLEDTTAISNYNGKINLSYAEFKNEKPSTLKESIEKKPPTLEDLGFKSKT